MDQQSNISDSILRKYNVIGCIVHFVQGLLMLIASQAIDNIKSFQKDITVTWLYYNEVTHSLENKTQVVAQFEVGLAAAIFLLMSAVAHLYILTFWERYLWDLSRGVNQARWYEYAASSTVMIISIAVLFGCYDLGSLILIGFSNSSMNLFGLLMELMNPPEREHVNWLPFIFGGWAGLAGWVIVFMYFLGGGNYSNTPDFVFAILIGYLIFFNTFPVNMVLQYSRYGKWADYRFGELVYIILSLSSKSLLAWLVFGGTNQPDGDDA